MLRYLYIALFLGSLSSYSQDTKLSDSCYFYMPNIITPDCEDYGCQFLQFNLECEIKNFQIIIYNRWGELIHESNDRDELWDPFTVLKETQILIWQITGEIMYNGAYVKVEWRGELNFLV